MSIEDHALNIDRDYILIVDDESEVTDAISSYLHSEGFTVSTASDESSALASIAMRRPSLILLDIVLNNDDGFAVCRRIRAEMDVPIVFLSGKSDDTEKIIGLEVGADDYLVKPFNPRELLARIKAVLRRYKHSEYSIAPVKDVSVGPWKIDVANQSLVGVNGEKKPLSTGEYRLLQVFINNPDQVLSRDQLLDLMHGRKSIPFDRSIDNYISRIRKKIEVDPNNPKILKTHWGSGYIFNSEKTEVY
ncbi:MAG: two-component system OmpR family response regulator [Pseudohongiellaceae bacterium]|jgi:two-component system OmpR family response regulator